MHMTLLPPPPPAVWPAEESSPLERLEAIEAEELRLLASGRAVGPCPSSPTASSGFRAERAELLPLVRRAPARV